MSDAIIETQTSGVMRATKAAYREMIKLSRGNGVHISPMSPPSHCRSPPRPNPSKESLHPAISSRSFASPQPYIHTHMYNNSFSQVIGQSEITFASPQTLASSPNPEAITKMNNITTTTTHSALPTTGTMSPPAPTTRPTAPAPNLGAPPLQPPLPL